MNKRGQGHIEMIISFTLFVGFVIFILLFLRPSTKSAEVSLNSIENALKDNLETDLSYFSIQSNGESCFCFTNSEYNIPGNIVVVNQEKERVDSEKKGDAICIKADGKRFFYVYSSDEFSDGRIDCSPHTITPEFGQLRQIKAISNNALEEMAEKHAADYDSLKNELGIVYYDFSIKFVDSTGQEIISMDKTPPLGRPVYSRDVPVQIVYDNGDITYGIMKIFAW